MYFPHNISRDVFDTSRYSASKFSIFTSCQPHRNHVANIVQLYHDQYVRSSMSHTMLESGESSSAHKAESRSVWYAASCCPLALLTSKTAPSGFSAFIATTASKAGACCQWLACCVPSDHGGYCCPAPIIRNCAITSACWLTCRLNESISATCLIVVSVSLLFSVCKWFWATRLFFSTDAPCFRFLGRHESQVSFPAHSKAQ